MKKYLLIAGAVFFSTMASAQITWNVKIGFGFSSCTTTGNADIKSVPVGKSGIGIEYPLSSNLSIMPSLEFAAKGAKDDKDYELNSTYVQIPVMGAYRINLNDSWNLTLKAGPYFAYGISAKMKGDGLSLDIFSESDMGSSKYTGDRLDVGLDVGLDFEYHRFVCGIEYERGFMNFFPKIDGVAEVCNQAFYATVGYKF